MITDADDKLTGFPSRLLHTISSDSAAVCQSASIAALCSPMYPLVHNSDRFFSAEKTTRSKTVAAQIHDEQSATVHACVPRR